MLAIAQQLPRCPVVAQVMTSALSRVAKRHNWTNARLNMVSRVMNVSSRVAVAAAVNTPRRGHVGPSLWAGGFFWDQRTPLDGVLSHECEL